MKMERHMKTQRESERDRGKGRQTETHPKRMLQRAGAFPKAGYKARETVV